MINLNEAKDILLYLIKNNEQLQEKGDIPLTVSLCGGAGIGKTSMVDALAKELDYNYIKLNLAQITEPGDLVGFPLKEFEIIEKNEDGTTTTRWIADDTMSTYFTRPCETYEVTGNSRMSYAIPAWLTGLDPNKGCIVNLDDFSRTTPAIAQAVMEIVNRQEYISWKLPPHSTIVLTQNPDDGSYNVNSSDEAQSSRYLNFDIVFDIDSWSSWAENVQLDSRGINFLLAYHHELMKENNQHRHVVNARNYTMFIKAISGLPDWSETKSLAFILQLASGCFLDDKDNIVGSLFTTFIANRLDKLITPADMLLKPWEEVKTKVRNCVNKDSQYRAEIASILATRLLNYSCYYFDKIKGAKTELVFDRIINFIEEADLYKSNHEESHHLLSEDLLFHILTVLMQKYAARSNKYILNPKIRSRIKL